MLDKTSDLESWWAVQYPCYSLRNLSQFPSYSTLQASNNPFKSMKDSKVEEFKLIDNCKIYESYCISTSTGHKLGHDLNSDTWFYEHWFPEDTCHTLVKTWMNADKEWGWVIRYYDSYELRQCWNIRNNEKFMEEFKITKTGTKGRRFRRNLRGSKTEDFFEKFEEMQDYSKKKKRWQKLGYSKDEKEVRNKDSSTFTQVIQDGNRHESKVIHKVNQQESGYIKWHTGNYFKISEDLIDEGTDSLDLEETCSTREDLKDEYVETEIDDTEFHESLCRMASLLLGSEGSINVKYLQNNLESLNCILKENILHYEQQFIDFIEKMQKNYPQNANRYSLDEVIRHEYRHDIPSLMEAYWKILTLVGEGYVQLVNKGTFREIYRNEICAIVPISLKCEYGVDRQIQKREICTILPEIEIFGRSEQLEKSEIFTIFAEVAKSMSSRQLEKSEICSIFVEAAKSMSPRQLEKSEICSIYAEAAKSMTSRQLEKSKICTIFSEAVKSISPQQLEKSEICSIFSAAVKSMSPRLEKSEIFTIFAEAAKSMSPRQLEKSEICSIFAEAVKSMSPRQLEKSEICSIFADTLKSMNPNQLEKNEVCSIFAEAVKSMSPKQQLEKSKICTIFSEAVKSMSPRQLEKSEICSIFADTLKSLSPRQLEKSEVCSIFADTLKSMTSSSSNSEKLADRQLETTEICSILSDTLKSVMSKQIETTEICSIFSQSSNSIIPFDSQNVIDKQLTLIKSALGSLLSLSLQNSSEFSYKLGENVDQLSELSFLDFRSGLSFSSVLSDIQQIYQVSIELSYLLHKFQSLESIKSALENLRCDIKAENTKKAYIIGKVLETLGLKVNIDLRSEYRSILSEQDKLYSDESDEIDGILRTITNNITLSQRETSLLEKSILQIYGEFQESVMNINTVCNSLIEDILGFISDYSTQNELNRLIHKTPSESLNIKQLEHKISSIAKILQCLRESSPRSFCSPSCNKITLEEQIKDLTRTRNRFEKQIDEYHHELLETNEDLNTSNSKLISLEKQMLQLRVDYSSISEEDKYLKNKLSTVEDLNQTYIDKIQALLNSNQSKTDEVKYLEDYIEDKIRKYTVKSEDLSSLNDYDELRNQFYILNQKYTDSERELVRMRKTLSDTVEEKRKLNILIDKTRNMILLTPKLEKEPSKKILELSPRRLLEAPKINRFSNETKTRQSNNPFLEVPNESENDLVTELEEHYRILGIKANLLDRIDQHLDNRKLLKRANITYEFGRNSL